MEKVLLTDCRPRLGEYHLSAPVTLDHSRHSDTAWVGAGDVLVSGGRQLSGDWKYNAAAQAWALPLAAGVPSDTTELYLNNERLL
jgi:hypothetical protein